MRPMAALIILVLSAWLPASAPAADSAVETSAEAEKREDVLLQQAIAPWKGDLDGILDRGFIRVATANSPFYFARNGVQRRGIAIELARELEIFLNRTYAKRGRRINVVLMPLGRHDILPAVIEGRADLAWANLTITPERSATVAFTLPTWTDVRELVVTGPAAPSITSIDDLVASRLHLRRSSSYYESIGALNGAREAEGKPPIPVEPMDEHLEDYDLLEMVNAGILPAIVVDSHKAAIWGQVFDDIVVHEDLFVREGGRIAWAVRRDNPKLLAALNRLIPKIRKGSLIGNVLIKRYLRNQEWIDNVRSSDASSRFDATLELIQTYAGRYDFDWLMIAAQAYQESKLDQRKRSRAGAVGIMQVMPATANDPVVGIPDIHEAESNVHAGVKYLRHLRESYDDEPAVAPLDRVLFAFAAYNAGPGNLRRARARAGKMGLDADRWFDNVEIAAARTISREPVIYVRNIFKYYVAYTLLMKARAQGVGAR